MAASNALSCSRASNAGAASGAGSGLVGFAAGGLVTCFSSLLAEEVFFLSGISDEPSCAMGLSVYSRPYRGISMRRDFARVAVECCTVIGGVLLIVGVAQGLTNYLVDAQVPDLLTDWAQSHIHSRYVFLLALNVILILKGSFMDVFSAIIVLVPLITPIAVGFGIDPVQLGIIFLANLELGYLT